MHGQRIRVAKKINDFSGSEGWIGKKLENQWRSTLMLDDVVEHDVVDVITAMIILISM